MATTLATIRDRIRTVLEAATPSSMSADKFRRCPNTARTVREWATESGGDQCLRKFDIRRVNDTGEPEAFSSGEMPLTESLLMTVAYPRLERLYGEDGLDDMEDVIRGDAAKIRDLLNSGSTWSTISGWSGTTGFIIHEPDRDGEVWFQTFTITIAYCEAVTLT